MTGYLRVRAHGTAYGLPLGDVTEVVDDVAWNPMPETRPAVRGVVTIRGQMMPLVSLHALLRDGAPADTASSTVVVVSHQGRAVALEVDDAEEVVRDPGLPVPPGKNMPWATGIAEGREELVPIVDLRVLDWRLTESSPGGAHERPTAVR